MVDDVSHINNKAEGRMMPRSVPTLDFENYTLTSPILSSREAEWEGIIVRLYREPAQVESVIVPTVPDIHLVLITHGAMHIESRDERGPWDAFRVHESELFLTPGGGDPYELRWRTSSSEPIESLHIHLSADLFARTAAQIADRDPTRLSLKDLSCFRDPLLAHVGLELQRELEHPTPAGQLYAETAAHMLAAHLLKHYLTTAVHITHYTQGLTHRQMQRITDYILAHLNEKLSLETLAQQVGFSAYHFTYLFRQTTGKTPHQFVLDKRLEQARQLLKATDLPLSQVALDVGFQNQSHFTQAFKSRLGVTPRQYRRQS
jgi:AraC family transcriptional regulator